MKNLRIFFSQPGNYFWLSLFCIVPFLQSERLVDPDYTPKATGLSLLLLLASAIILLKKIPFYLYARPVTFFFLFVAVYTGLSLFSLLKSINPGDGMSDLVKLLLPLFFLPVFLVLLEDNRNTLATILKLNNLAVFIFTAFGLVQIYELWNVTHIQQTEFVIGLTISSTLGNKNFFSETLLMLIPFSVAGIFILTRPWKVISIVSVILSVSFILMLNSRSVMVALAVSLFCVLPVAISSSRARLFFFRPYRVIGFIVVLSGILLLGFQKRVFQNAFTKFKAVTSTFTIDPGTYIRNDDPVNENSYFTRYLLWRNSVRLFREQPLSGTGLGNWKVEHPKYGIGGAYYINSGSTRFEHPHNEYLMMLAERGSIVTASWLLILGLPLFLSVRMALKRKNTPQRILMLSAAGGIIAFLVISVFGYPLYRSYTPFLLMLMIAVVLAACREDGQAPHGKNLARPVFIVLAVAGLASFTVHLKRLGSETLIKKAHAEQSLSHFDRMKNLIASAENYFFPIDLTSTPLSWYKGHAESWSGRPDSALYYYLLAEQVNPYHIHLLNDIGACYENTGHHEKAITYFNRALVITPMFKDALINITVAYYNTGRLEEAYRLIHTFESGDFYITCRKSVVTAAVEKILAEEKNQEMSAYFHAMLPKPEWFIYFDKKTDTSLSHLKNLMLEEYTINKKDSAQLF